MKTIRLGSAVLTIFISLPALAAETNWVSSVGEGIAKVYSGFGVSEAVRAGDFLYVGGIVAVDENGEVIAPYDGKTQLQVIYDRIKILLEKNGAGPKDVVSETIYLTDWVRFGAGESTRKAFYTDAGAAFPTAAAVEVATLAAAGLVLEVELVAYLGD